jgi:hypothetical protein
VTASSRDRYSDTSRDGSGQMQKKDVGFELDFGPTTVEREKEQGGFENNDTPTGAVRPNAQMTSNSR